jgi:hypothetical protein
LDICSFGFIKFFNDLTPLCATIFVRGPITTSPNALTMDFYGGSPRP